MRLRSVILAGLSLCLLAFGASAIYGMHQIETEGCPDAAIDPTVNEKWVEACHDLLDADNATSVLGQAFLLIGLGALFFWVAIWGHLRDKRKASETGGPGA